MLCKQKPQLQQQKGGCGMKKKEEFFFFIDFRAKLNYKPSKSQHSYVIAECCEAIFFFLFHFISFALT